MTDLKPAQVAIELGVHLETVKRLLRSGELPGFRVGRLWRVSPEALTEYRNRPNSEARFSLPGTDGKRPVGRPSKQSSSKDGQE